jgi:neurotrophic tyrosine kinase receptor type 2
MLSPLDTSREMFDQDIEMLSSINHTNVVGLLAICTKDNPECLLLDAGLPGDLLSYIREKKMEMTPHIATEAETKELLRIADDISLGMAYLASERFIHKDLALRNCIINFNGVVKIAHFGLGPLVYPEAYYRVSNTDLPIRWMSPEAITSANFTTMSDIWSFGVAVWELFTYGSLPFEDKRDNEVLEFILQEGRLSKPKKCSNNVFEIIMGCWNDNPQLRPSFYDLHENIADLAGIQSPLSALGPATPVSPLSPLTPTGMFSVDSGVPSTFKS